MSMRGKVLLIVGPAGSGKSTLAKYTSKKLGWELVEEDSYWVAHNWGSGMRTEEQESVIQQEVSEHITKLCTSGKSVVIEFILYKKPPNPLTNYLLILQEAGITCSVIALKPSLDTILDRQRARGRQQDIKNAAENREHAANQINCLDEEYIKDFAIDNSHLSVEETFEQIRTKL